MPAFVAILLVLLAAFFVWLLTFIGIKLLRWLQASADLKRAQAEELRARSVGPIP